MRGEQDRESAHADRVAGADNRDHAGQDRGTALSDRGAAAEDRDNGKDGNST